LRYTSYKKFNAKRIELFFYLTGAKNRIMKKLFTTFFLIHVLFLMAQNSQPQINITSVAADTTTQTIQVVYSVSDADNDPLEIMAYLSSDSGYAHVAHVVSITGDVGFPVQPGTNRSLTIQYNVDSLFQSSMQNSQTWVGVKLVASDLKPVDIADIIQSIDSTSVYNDMLFLSQPRHHVSAPSGLTTIKDSLDTRFNRYNLQTQRLPFSYIGTASENILGRQAGSHHEKSVIIVDGHFDAVANTPGADDNASAVAGVLAASRVLSGYHFKKSINYIGFDKEEQGLIGAAQYVNNSIKPFEQIEAVLNMEMIAYYSDAINSQQIPPGFGQLFPAAVDSIMASGNRGIFLFTIGNTFSASLSSTFDSVARLYVPGVRSLVLNVPGNGQIAQDLRRSDHAVFWDAGYKALMLTDAANFRNPYYHTPGDSLGTLNIPFLVRNIKAVVATAAALAQPISADADVAIVGQLISHIAFGVDENLLLRDVELYPNPSTGDVYARFDRDKKAVRIAVIDQAGKVVYNATKDVEAGIPVQLHVHTAGAYVLEIHHNTQTLRRKFVVSEGHSH